MTLNPPNPNTQPVVEPRFDYLIAGRVLEETAPVDQWVDEQYDKSVIWLLPGYLTLAGGIIANYLNPASSIIKLVALLGAMLLALSLKYLLQGLLGRHYRTILSRSSALESYRKTHKQLLINTLKLKTNFLTMVKITWPQKTLMIGKPI